MLPIIMMHRSGHTSVTCETMPDGWEGWAPFFVHREFPEDVVDHPSRTRSGFDRPVINLTGRESNATLIPSISLFSTTRAWVTADVRGWPALSVLARRAC